MEAEDPGVLMEVKPPTHANIHRGGRAGLPAPCSASLHPSLRLLDPVKSRCAPAQDCCRVPATAPGFLTSLLLFRPTSWSTPAGSMPAGPSCCSSCWVLCLLLQFLLGPTSAAAVCFLSSQVLVFLVMCSCSWSSVRVRVKSSRSCPKASQVFPVSCVVWPCGRLVSAPLGGGGGVLSRSAPSFLTVFLTCPLLACPCVPDFPVYLYLPPCASLCQIIVVSSHRCVCSCRSRSVIKFIFYFIRASIPASWNSPPHMVHHLHHHIMTHPYEARTVSIRIKSHNVFHKCTRSFRNPHSVFHKYNSEEHKCTCSFGNSHSLTHKYNVKK
ncbi:uncharacterized protein [Nothobranchius furzeri]|uniref:uncharacterized protein isoform X1 n=1 Tax=Nothobranchius furzeri TaxID=105023 RepID=UPI003904884F